MLKELWIMFLIALPAGVVVLMLAILVSQQGFGGRRESQKLDSCKICNVCNNGDEKK